MSYSKVEGSFRDPSGFLFWENGCLYRQINVIYKEDYKLLMSSGLYNALLDNDLMIPHTEVDTENMKSDKGYKIIKPELLDFVSYPYEWSFSQLKDAALTTLQIQRLALDYGMSLKDSSAYNIQFRNGKPIFIDTLSFEKYKDGSPWVAYKQFCQHFLAPLALMSYRDIRLSQLLKVYIDGIPLDLASSLLPGKTKLNFSMLTNIHLHAKSQQRYSAKKVDLEKYKISMSTQKAMIDSYISSIEKLKWNPAGTEWGDYYNATNYTDDSFEHKKTLVSEFLKTTNSKSVWDLGANTGVFSRIASDQGIKTLAFDIDPVAVEKNYLYLKEKKETCILPLLLDLMNPSPSIGWDNSERSALKERNLPDTVFALALIHHLAISNNVPLGKIAKFFSTISNYLIIEFVPKTDSQVERLLATREDIFCEYHIEGFTNSFNQFFEIIVSEKIRNSERVLFLMKKLKD